jgi:transposase
MSRFIVGADRHQVTLLPECLDDFVAEDNTVRIVDAFINELDLADLGFEGAIPAATGRPSYHPSVEAVPIRISQPHPVQQAS